MGTRAYPAAGLADRIRLQRNSRKIGNRDKYSVPKAGSKRKPGIGVKEQSATRLDQVRAPSAL